MLSKTTYRKLRQITTMAGLWAFIQAEKPKPKKSMKASRLRRIAKAATHSKSTGAIREAVLRRSGFDCEGTDGGRWESHCRGALQMDHWLGGNGRRRQRQSLETCWMLCAEHHRRRTEGVPSVAMWNERFEKHCAKYGYPFTPHIEHAKVARNVRASGEQQTDRPKANP